VTALKHVKASVFRKKAFSIKLAGSSMEDGIAYRWTTIFKFERVR
jgi:hypothetical protein